MRSFAKKRPTPREPDEAASKRKFLPEGSRNNTWKRKKAQKRVDAGLQQSLKAIKLKEKQKTSTRLGPCHVCGQMGHLKEHCPKPISTEVNIGSLYSAQSSETSTRVMCFFLDKADATLLPDD